MRKAAMHTMASVFILITANLGKEKKVCNIRVDLHARASHSLVQLL